MAAGLLLLLVLTLIGPSTGGDLPSADSEPQLSRTVEQWPPNVSFLKVLEKFVPLISRNNFFVNIGAQKGDSYDPVYHLLLHSPDTNYSGIAFEGDKMHFADLKRNLMPFNASRNIRIAEEFVDPQTISTRLAFLGCPIDVDVLKLDIDSIDFEIMSSILSNGFRPKIVMMEVNNDIPPPFLWYQKLPRASGAVTYKGNYGVSPASAFQLMNRFEYSVVSVELGSYRDLKCVVCEHNMWFVRTDFYQSALKTSPNHLSRIRNYLSFNRAYWSAQIMYSNALKGFNASPKPALKCAHIYRCPFDVIESFASKQFPSANTSDWRFWSKYATHLMSAAGAQDAKVIVSYMEEVFTFMEKKSKGTNSITFGIYSF